MAVFSATWTSLMGLLILYWQLRSWILTGDWSPFSVSEALELTGLTEPAVGMKANSLHRQFAWFFDLPASGVLFAIAAILIALAILATSIETQFSEPED